MGQGPHQTCAILTGQLTENPDNATPLSTRGSNAAGQKLVPGVK